MKIENFIADSVMGVSPSQEDFKDYCKLKHDKSINLSFNDFPEEFSEKAYSVIVDFVQKTRNLNYKWILYFDYKTGEILGCSQTKNVVLDFKDNKYNIASIQNHPKNILPIPSDKHFEILKSDFEDYELIARHDDFWIFKAKGTHEKLYNTFKNFSSYVKGVLLMNSLTGYFDEETVSKMHNMYYRYLLLKYGCDVELTKKEYKSNIATYCPGIKKPDLNTINYIKRFFNLSFMPSFKELWTVLFKDAGFDYEEIFSQDSFNK